MLPVPRLKFVCKTCGAVFERRKKEVARPDHAARYCSHKCRQLGMRRRGTLRCTQCGKKFERKLSDIKRRGKLAWCSWKCWKLSHPSTKAYPKIGRRHAHRVIAELK